MKKCSKCNETYDDSWTICLKCRINLVKTTSEEIRKEYIEKIRKIDLNKLRKEYGLSTLFVRFILIAHVVLIINLVLMLIPVIASRPIDL